MSDKQQSTLGVLIDSSMEDFKDSVSSYNVGVINSLILTFTEAYTELDGRKEAIMSSGEISLEDKEKAVKGLFSEMLKIEEKVTYLRKRVGDLRPKVFDTEKS